MVSDRFVGVDLIDGFFAGEEGSSCNQKFDPSQLAWSKRKKSPDAGQNWVLFRLKKKNRDERILEFARLRVAEEEDSCCHRLKISEKPHPLLPRPVVAKGGRAFVLVLIPEPELKEDNPVL